MATSIDLDASTRQALALRYAQGEITIHDVRRAGHWRMIERLSDLAELGEPLPLAAMTGPHMETRRAGIERLDAILRR
jgi:hypothetical protein